MLLWQVYLLLLLKLFAVYIWCLFQIYVTYSVRWNVVWPTLWTTNPCIALLIIKTWAAPSSFMDWWHSLVPWGEAEGALPSYHWKTISDSLSRRRLEKRPQGLDSLARTSLAGPSLAPWRPAVRRPVALWDTLRWCFAFFESHPKCIMYTYFPILRVVVVFNIAFLRGLHRVDKKQKY